MQPIARSRLVWISLQASAGRGTVVSFPQLDAIRGKAITGIQAFSAEDMTVTPDGVAVIPDVLNMFLNLLDGSKEQQFRIPGNSLRTGANAGVWKEFTPFVPDWQRSYVEFGSAVVVPAGGNSIPFLVFYLP